MKESLVCILSLAIICTTCIAGPVPERIDQNKDSKATSIDNIDKTKPVQQQALKETPKSKRALSLLHAPTIVSHAPTVYAAHAPIISHAPVVAHAAPAVVAAPLAAKVATSYSTVRIQHISHAPVVAHAAPLITHAAPVIHAPVLHAAPLLHPAPLLHAPLTTSFLHAPLATSLYHAPLTTAYHAPYHAPLLSSFHL